MWYQTSYRRNLVDMHIPDWHPEFMADYEPARHVELLQRAQVKTAMVYANSHVGLCYWPTKAGRMHGGLGGRDVLGEFLSQARAAGLDTVVYYSLIFNNWLAETYPDWQMVDAAGDAGFVWGGRYGVCCPNVPEHRGFIANQIAELSTAYDFDGMFFDMAFWPKICYCDACRRRYHKELGGKPPETVNWQDPQWVEFQRARETWLAEFAVLATRKAKEYKPEVSVEHNSATLTHDWQRGAALDLRDANDFIGGDLYGGFSEQSFVCKFYDSITPDKPFEYMTSRCDPSLASHTTSKTQDALALHNWLTLAHNGAFLFIDAADPAGTLQPEIYNTMGAVFAESKPYEPHLGGELCADIGIYFSPRAKFDPYQGGSVSDLGVGAYPHLTASVRTAGVLQRAHIPYDVISRPQLDDLARFQVVCVLEPGCLEPDEVEALRAFVCGGGALFLSGLTAAAAFQYELGITAFVGRTEADFTYLSPTDLGESLFPGVTQRQPLSVRRPQVQVKSASADILARVVVPYTTPAEAQFASIHSNPPGTETPFAGTLRRAVGQGTIFWLTDCPAQEPTAVHQRVLEAQLRSLCRRSLQLEPTGHPAVEFLLYHQPDRNQWTLRLANLQDSLPAVPVSGLRCRLRTGADVLRVVRLPHEQPVPFHRDGAGIEFALDSLELFSMYAIQYRRA